MDQQQFKEQLTRAGVDFCFIQKQYDNQLLKFIVIGDNPGKEEIKQRDFFVGPSGKALRRFFSENGLSSDFNKECRVFSKTCIHTARTHELGAARKKTGRQLFDSILESNASEAAALANRLKLPVLVLGKSQLSKGGLFEAFWHKLYHDLRDKKQLLVFNHPSRNMMAVEWKKYRAQFPTLKTQELLEKTGTDNAERIRASYSNKKISF